MSVITQNHILNIVPGMSAPVVVHVSQGDSGVELEFVLVNGSEIFDPTGTVISVHGIRQDGTGWGPVACAREDGKIKFTLPDAATAVKGSGMAELSISNGEETVGTTNFAILVETATFPQGVTYANDVSVYEAILAYVDQMGEQTVQNVEADLAAEIANRQAADAVLQQNINSEASTRAGADTTLQTNLNNAVSSLNEALAQEVTNRTIADAEEVTAREAADNLLDARIDQIIAPSGEAPSAAEVADARVGADGVTYDTLGTAIRTQVSGLNSSFSNLLEFTNNEFDESPFVVGKNLYNPNTFNKLSGLYVSYSNGGVYTSATNTAIAIKVTGGEVLSINKPYVNLAFFDKWQPINVYQVGDIIEGYISGVAGDANNMTNVSIPATAKMATISVSTSLLATLQIEYGATNTTREVYSYKLPNSAINDNLIDTVYRKALLQSAGKNLFNKDTSDKISGNYVSYSTSQIIANASYTAYVVEIDDDNSVISINEPYVHLAFYNRFYDITSYTTGQYLPYYISGAVGDASGIENESIPSGAKMAVVSINTAHASSVQVEYGATCTDYEPYLYGISGSKIWPDSLPEDRIQKYTHTFTVKADNTGDFDSLRDCFDAINVLSDRGRVLVEIYEGTYDIRADYTNEEWTAAGFVGLTVPHDVSLIGIGLKDDILITCTSETPTSAISTLNVTYNVEIENLTIYGEALRYTIHDDYSINGKDLKTIVKNCDIIGNDLVYYWVWGAGTYGGSYKEFDNVRFVNLSGADAFSTHDSVSPSKNSECQIFNNCEFIGLIRGRIRICPAKSGVTQTLIFNGCMFDLFQITSQFTGDDNSTTVYNLIGHGNTEEITTTYYNDHDKLTIPRFGDRTHAGKNASGSTITAGDYVKRSTSPAGMVIGTSDNNDGIAINTVSDGGIVYFK